MSSDLPNASSSSISQSHDVDVIVPLDAVGEVPAVRKIGLDDLGYALKNGIDDFLAMPTHAVYLDVIYAVVGLLLARIAFGGNLFALLYPIATGFALIGPFAAIGLYELSRRREAGLDTHWLHVFDVRHSPSFKSILILGAALLAMFVLWIALAQGIFIEHFGREYNATFSQFVNDALNTSRGHQMIVAGNLVGLAFAIVAMAVSVVAFPLLLDRNVGVAAAVATSIKAVLRNPVAMMAWGLIVAGLLLLGVIPLLMGLAVILPILGHSTWHLYRRLVEADTRERPQFKPRSRPPRYAADFPASLFVRSSVAPPDAE